jgi:predicted DNA binding CopG/RHH family protein
MARKQSASSARDRLPSGSAKHISDPKIDFSDVPESTDEELSRATRVGRPRTGNAKQLIAFRIEPALLAKLRKLAAKKGRPYQTLLHEIIESAVKKAA